MRVEINRRAADRARLWKLLDEIRAETSDVARLIPEDCAEVTGSYEGLRMTSLFQDGTKGIEDGLHGVEFWRDRPRGGA